MAFTKSPVANSARIQKARNGKREAIGERGNSLFKATFTALRNVSLKPVRSLRSLRVGGGVT